MTYVRRLVLGVLTVALLAVTATAVGYAMRQPTGPDLPLPVTATPAALSHDTAPAEDPAAAPSAIRTPIRSTEPAAGPASPARSQHRPLRTMEPGRALLSPGADSGRVRDLQARLKQLYWFAGEVTGTYGEVTTEAVRGFQAKRRIPVTGVVDRRTLDRLHAMTSTPTYEAKFNLGNRPGPMDARCLTGRVLCIDKTSQTLRWVVDGEVVTTVDVRFGSAATPTREGRYSVYYKSRDHVSELYDSAMPYAMFFSGGQAVHYSSDFASAGYSGASHGCVNVRDYDAVAWLFDRVRVGDSVIVYWS